MALVRGGGRRHRLQQRNHRLRAQEHPCGKTPAAKEDLHAGGHAPARTHTHTHSLGEEPQDMWGMSETPARPIPERGCDTRARRWGGGKCIRICRRASAKVQHHLCRWVALIVCPTSPGGKETGPGFQNRRPRSSELQAMTPPGKTLNQPLRKEELRRGASTTQTQPDHVRPPKPWGGQGGAGHTARARPMPQALSS